MDRKAMSQELEALLAGEEGAKLIAFFKRSLANADECLHETIARALAAAEGYVPDPKRPLAAWVWAFAWNVVHERRRGVAKDRKRLGFMGEYAESDPETAEPAPEQPLEQDEKRALVRKAVAALPEEQRVVIELSVFGGLSQKQIGEALGLTERGVQHRLSLAREALAESLRKLGF